LKNPDAAEKVLEIEPPLSSTQWSIIDLLSKRRTTQKSHIKSLRKSTSIDPGPRFFQRVLIPYYTLEGENRTMQVPTREPPEL
jgi:hypothetical protein